LPAGDAEQEGGERALDGFRALAEIGRHPRKRGQIEIDTERAERGEGAEQGGEAAQAFRHGFRCALGCVPPYPRAAAASSGRLRDMPYRC
jgi:hypothetical protein